MTYATATPDHRLDLVLRALSDPTRRAMIERLSAGPCPVGALAEELPVSRPAVSQHLRMLADAGIVTAEAQGARRIYRLCDAGPAELRAYVDRLWSDALTAFEAAAHAEAARTRKDQTP